MGNWGGVSPASVLESYWYDKYNEVLAIKDAKVTLLQGPAHGVVEASNFVSELGPYFEYAPNPGFLGEDKITFLIELGDKHVKVVITLIVVENSVDQGDSPCFRGAKRIGSTDTSTLTTDLATWISTSQLDSLFSDNASLNFTDLPGTAVGQTVGSSITLDTNAAGNGWFIDTTPNLNEEWLPTSNPNEWVAKAGSAAEGKMDMLSVLLHEYGHALGIDHRRIATTTWPPR